MELLQLFLVLMGAILISAVLEPLLPRVSLPLVQIVIGVLLYWFVELPADFTINSDLFLVLFIAPLLFDESKSANNRELMKSIGAVLSLAIGLVLVTALVIAFTLHWIVPSVSLAAAFALGAALGPTDAVAVASLGKEVNLNRRQKTLLTGEALLNDASGVVTFQFAIAAAVTGAFSVAEATGAFVIEFCGGIVIGALIAIVAYFIARGVRRAGVESVTFHVCYEIFIPFFSYIVASACHIGDTHFSGILAVVSAGLLFTSMPQLASPRSRRLNTFSARFNIASSSVWSILSFIFNGIVFVYLGFMFPSTIAPAIEEATLPTIWIIGIALLLVVLIVGIRLVWVLVLDLISKSPETDLGHVSPKCLLRNALVTTLAGPKGAVSLSIALTIPVYISSDVLMPVRDLLLFLTCAVIIVTLLIANFVVPIISPQQDEESEQDTSELKAQIEILENVIRELRRQRTDANRQAIALVIRSLNERKASLQRVVASNRQLRFLRQEVLVKQEDYIKEQVELENVDRRIAERYLKRIDRMKTALKRKGTSQTAPVAQNRPLASATTPITRIQHNLIDSTNEERRRIEFKAGVEQVAVDYLAGVVETDDAERVAAARALLSEHQPLLAALQARLHALNVAEGIEDTAEFGAVGARMTRSANGSLRRSRTVDESTVPQLDDVREEAFRLELDEIQGMRDEGRLSNATARDMREEIYLMQMSLAID